MIKDYLEGLMKYLITPVFFLAISLNVTAQGKYKIDPNSSKATFSLVSELTGKAQYSSCQSIEAVGGTANSEMELYVIVKSGKLILFDGRNSVELWQRVVKKSESTYQLSELQGRYKLVAYAPSGREAVLISDLGIIYPKGDVMRYPDDFQKLVGSENYFVVGWVDPSSDKYHEGVIDRSGNQILRCEYDDILMFHESNGTIEVKREKWSGIMGTDGSEIIPIAYTSVIPAGRMFIAEKEGKVGVITSSDVLLEFAFEFIDNRRKSGCFNEGRLHLLFEGSPVAIDTSMESMSRASAYLGEHKSYDYYNRYVTHYDETQFADEDDVWRIIDEQTGLETIPRGYHKGVGQDVVELKGGVAVSKDGKFGVLNIETGKPMIPLEYDIPYIRNSELPYKQGAFYARIIRRDLKEISDTNVVVVVLRNGKAGLVDLNGKVVLPFIYDEIIPGRRCEDLDLIMVKLAGRYGMIDESTFELVIPCEYEVIRDCESGKKYVGDKDYVPLKRGG